MSESADPKQSLEEPEAKRIPLVFIRHGETEWNRELRYQGQKDVPLNDHGRRQAERNGRTIAGILATGEWQLVSSPLGRAMETMQLVLAAAGQPHRAFSTDPVLKEVNYGDWEGLTLTEIGERFPEEAAAREADKWGYVPPNGESYAMLAARVADWLATLGGPTFVVGAWRDPARADAHPRRASGARRAASRRAAGPGDSVHREFGSDRLSLKVVPQFEIFGGPQFDASIAAA